MFTILSYICLSITGGPLPEGIFDDHFFYQLRTKKKISEDILCGVRQLGKHTPHQLAIMGFPHNESKVQVEKVILHSKKFSDYFFKEGRPSHVSILDDPIDYGIHGEVHCIYHNVVVNLYFEDEEKMDAAGHRLFQNGVHPKKGYKLHPRKIGALSTCCHCERFLPLVSEKNRNEKRRITPKKYIQHIANNLSDSQGRRGCICMI